MTFKSSTTHYQLIDLTQADFKQTVIESGRAFVIQIQADWCGECYIMSTILKQMAAQFADQITFGFINVDTNEEIAKHYGVTELPFLLFFNRGELVDFLIGLQSKKTALQYIEKTLSFEK